MVYLRHTVPHMEKQMRFPKRLAVMVVAVGVCLAQSFTLAPAAEPDGRKLAEELLTLTNTEKTLAGMRAQIGQMMTAQLKSMDVPADLRDTQAKFQQRILDVVFDELSFEKMKPDYIDVYSSTFTTDELSGLVAFYKSPAGRAFADKLPTLTQRLMEVSQSRIQALGPRIKKMTEDFVAEVKSGTKQP